MYENSVVIFDCLLSPLERSFALGISQDFVHVSRLRLKRIDEKV